MIRTGTAALERLELLARLFWPTTEAFLARTRAFTAARFLDVGCGIGDVACRVATSGAASATGIDANAEVVRAAMRRADERRIAARFRTATLADLRVVPELSGFDVVYARCLVSHLPDPGDALASMVAAASPGGSILIEDVDVDAVWSSPPCEALMRHAHLYVDAACGLGAHPDVGSELAGLLVGLGANDVEVDVVQPVLRRPEDLQIHARTMEAIADLVVAQGLATRAEVDDLVTRLDQWAATPGTVATLPRIVQVAARAPVAS